MGPFGAPADVSVPNERPARDVGCSRDPRMGSTMLPAPARRPRFGGTLRLRDAAPIDVDNPKYGTILRCLEPGPMAIAGVGKTPLLPQPRSVPEVRWSLSVSGATSRGRRHHFVRPKRADGEQSRLKHPNGDLTRTSRRCRLLGLLSIISLTNVLAQEEVG
jgi:hypothetical protein